MGTAAHPGFPNRWALLARSGPRLPDAPADSAEATAASSPIDTALTAEAMPDMVAGTRVCRHCGLAPTGPVALSQRGISATERRIADEPISPLLRAPVA